MDQDGFFCPMCAERDGLPKAFRNAEALMAHYDKVHPGVSQSAARSLYTVHFTQFPKRIEIILCNAIGCVSVACSSACSSCAPHDHLHAFASLSDTPAKVTLSGTKDTVK